MKHHKFANLFPMMSDEELSALVDDMRQYGYDKTAPIVTLNDEILDGRNRFKAAGLAGVTPVFVTFKGNDPLEFIIRHNLKRRHLNETQRAGVAAKIANMRQGERTDLEPSANLQKVSQAKAAEMLNVGGRTVATYRAVAEAMPELVPLMDSGQMTAHEASKKVQETKRTDARAKIAQIGASVKPSDRWHVYHGDIATWKAPRQYDFIITDPPYPKEYLPLWEVLARQANEWLKDGGLLIAMSGQSYLNEIYKLLDQHMTYYWTASYLTPGQPTPLRQVNVNSTWKPLLIYSKGKYTGKIFGDVFISPGNDKDNHKWGQSEGGMFDIISKICLPGQTILDPFCGAGTTGIAALKHGCLFDGLELDIDNVNISKGRLA
jgi:site-specific DNA-methyltransferase (adenine-specific)